MYRKRLSHFARVGCSRVRLRPRAVKSPARYSGRDLRGSRAVCFMIEMRVSRVKPLRG